MAARTCTFTSRKPTWDLTLTLSTIHTPLEFLLSKNYLGQDAQLQWSNKQTMACTQTWAKSKIGFCENSFREIILLKMDYFAIINVSALSLMPA